jgi:hypothetical protein
MNEGSGDLLADFLAKRRKRLADELLERFKKAKGRGPASLDEFAAFLAEERLNGKQS